MRDTASALTPPPANIATADRRAPQRLPCADLPEVRYLLRPSMQHGWGLLRDLSAEGVGLLLPKPLDPGAVLFVQFPGPRRGTPHTQLARVVHATPCQPDFWLVGCRLTPPLSGQDLARLRGLLARR